MASAESVVAQLLAAGYTHRGREVLLGQLRLAFEGVLTGPGESAGLVCIDDPSEVAWETLARKARSLLLGLQSMGSRRHVALVVIGQPEDERLGFGLSSMVRTIWVPKETDEAETPAYLEPLLTLALPQPLPPVGAGMSLLRNRFRGPDPFVDLLLMSAEEGSEAVTGALVDQVNRLGGDREQAD